MKRNWIKMYNKEGLVLRVETLIASPLRQPHHGGCAQVTMRWLTRTSTPTLP